MNNTTKKLTESLVPSGSGLAPLRKAHIRAIGLLLLGVLIVPTRAFSQNCSALSARDDWHNYGTGYNQIQNQAMQRYNNIMNQLNAEQTSVNDAAQAIGQALNAYNHAKRDNEMPDDSSDTVDTSSSYTPPADNPVPTPNPTKLYYIPAPTPVGTQPHQVNPGWNVMSTPDVPQADAPPPEKYSGFFDSQNSGSPSQFNHGAGSTTAGGAMAQQVKYDDYFANGDSGSPNQDFVPVKDLSKNSLPGTDPFTYQMPQATKVKIQNWINRGMPMTRDEYDALEAKDPLASDYNPTHDVSIPWSTRIKIAQLVQQQQEKLQEGGPTLGTKLGNVWNNVKQQVNNVFDPLGSVVNDNQDSTAPQGTDEPSGVW